MIPTPAGRGLYCNRTLNLRAIRAVGYDMDYTLVHYNTREWERRAYGHLRRRLLDRGWPVGDLVFDPDMMIRGLIIDTALGNIVKANRFGYVKAAAHGTRQLGFEDQRSTYSRTVVDLTEERWVFLNTLFSLSEAVMYAQLVERLDKRSLPGAMGYDELYEEVRVTLDAAHMEGQLKAEIVAQPEVFLELDPLAAVALQDQKAAGKRLALITNSDYEYTRFMMATAYDPYLPAGTTWRDLFDLVIVSARKPDFFWSGAPAFEVVSEEGLLRHSPGGLRVGGVFVGGHAGLVERAFDLDGSEVLYVGDHIYGDVHVSKKVRRWRTALVVRELETELEAEISFSADQARLVALMDEKASLEAFMSRARMATLRHQAGYAAPGLEGDVPEGAELTAARVRLIALEESISTLARSASELVNSRWGLLMRTGNDKSHLARQVERHADVYTSRVSNFVYATPFAFLRSPRGSLPHDPAAREPSPPDF